MIFAYDGIGLISLCDEFEKLRGQYQPEHCPDGVWVLSQAS